MLPPSGFMQKFLAVSLLVLIAMCPGNLPADDASRIDALGLAGGLPSMPGIRYDGLWHPPGETAPWRMDCSNTVRWLARTAMGVSLPRTASAQYEYLARHHDVRRVGRDPRRLAEILRPGDLLFWENTYRPRRRPPITHVMMYLGRDNAGQMRMAGSQSSRGVGIYPFRPEQEWGGYRWLLFFKRPGRFVAYGRLREMNQSALPAAANPDGRIR
ncbi:MAG TPA: NlpC/P60 family protein [Terrimicrobiaceae bacterium]|nr:NlpC/P60 family protein [Terrimicrobiaceae bacterium]